MIFQSKIFRFFKNIAENYQNIAKIRSNYFVVAEIREKALAAVQNIAVCTLKIARIPRVGDIAGVVGEVEKPRYHAAFGRRKPL